MCLCFLYSEKSTPTEEITSFSERITHGASVFIIPAERLHQMAGGEVTDFEETILSIFFPLSAEAGEGSF